MQLLRTQIQKRFNVSKFQFASSAGKIIWFLKLLKLIQKSYNLQNSI